MAKVIPVTDPDEAVSLFRAGLLMFRCTGRGPEPLVDGWTEELLRMYHRRKRDGGFVILIEDDDEEGDSTTTVSGD